MMLVARGDAAGERLRARVEAVGEGKDVDVDLLSVGVLGLGDVEALHRKLSTTATRETEGRAYPKQTSNVDEDAVTSDPHTGADTTTKAEGRVPELTRVIPLLQEPLRLEIMRVREILLIQVDTPKVRDDSRALGDTHALIHVLLNDCVGGTPEDGDGAPAEGLGENGTGVGEVVVVFEGGETVRADDAVEFLLGFGDEVLAEGGAGEEEADQSTRGGLNTSTD
jgi:hypothetical protein